MNNIKKLISKPLFLPIFCMLLVMAVNIIYDVASGNFAFNFFTISIRNGVLYGRIIDILNRWFGHVTGSVVLLYAACRLWSFLHE